MKSTVYRSVSSPRRTPRPRPARQQPGAAGFSGLLGRLAGASDSLAAARQRVRKA